MSVDVLQEKIRKLKNPSMVGLDPTRDLIPEFLLQEAFAECGENLEGLARAFYRFCSAILETLKETVPAVKVQTACFEALGAPGVAVMQTLCREAREMGYYVVLDAMRGDAPHIAELYASAVFGPDAVYDCDALTINGYLGSDSIKPFLPYCKDSGKAVFLLIRTSNRSGREVQDLLSGDRQVFTAMADLAMRWSNGLFGRHGYSQVGAVMPATDQRSLSAMRHRYNRLFFLVAGYGAQGGIARHAAAAFDEFGHGAVISASRSILAAWKKEEGNDGTDFALRALEAAVKMKKDISKFVTVM